MARNKMSVLQLTFLTALNMMGSGIIMLPAKIADVGMISLLGWAFTIVGVIALTYSFAKCGMLTDRTGGLGGFATYAFGEAGSFLTNLTYAIALLISNVAVAMTSIGYLMECTGIEASPFVGDILITLLLVVSCLVNAGGARLTGLLSATVIWGVFLPVLAFVCAAPFHFDPALFAANWNPDDVTLMSSVSDTVPMLLWCFLGLESACANSDAVDNPQKNVPIAVTLATLGVGFFYVVTTLLIGGIVPNANLVNSSAPFAVIFSMMFGSQASAVMTFLMALACAGSLISWQFTASCVFKSTADSGFLPGFFSRVNRFSAPVQGMIVILIVQIILLGVSATPQLFGHFAVLVDLAVVTNVTTYMLCMSSLFVMLAVEEKDLSSLTLSGVLAGLSLVYIFYVFSTFEHVTMTANAVIFFAGMTGYALIAAWRSKKGTGAA